MLRSLLSVRKSLPLLVVLVLVSALAAQDKEVVSKGQVKVGTYAAKLEAGKLYMIKVEGAGFMPQVSIRPGYFTNTSNLDQGDTFQAYFVPRESRDHRIFILPSLSDDVEGGALDYTLTVKPIPLAEKPLLSEKSELKASDPPYKSEDGVKTDGPHKAFTLKMKARQMYIIEMHRVAKDMDPYMMLEGPGGKIVASDDDGGGDSNARIIIQPRRDGEYKIVASTISKGLGAFSITVRSTAQE